MALIVGSKTHLVVCVLRDVIVINRATKNVNKITIPLQLKESRESNGKSGGNNEDADDADSDGEEKNVQTSPSNQIHLACISQCGTLLAVTTIGDKLLHILRINEREDTATVLAQQEVHRVASAIRFSPDSKLLLLADKTGGCFQIDIKQGDSKWILGHLSIVLDVLLTPNQDSIITCDRDEKVRVTRFPSTHIIESYCLGHSEYVSAIELLRNDERTLVTVSGDKTARLWNYRTGEQLDSIVLNAPGYKLALNEFNHVAIVLLSAPLTIAFFKVSADGSARKLIALGEQQLDDDIKQISSIFFTQKDQLLLSAINVNDEALVRAYAIDDQDRYRPVVNELSELLAKQLTNSKIEHIEDLSILFKKKFDNLKDYHERKRRRIEEKQQIV